MEFVGRPGMDKKPSDWVAGGAKKRKAVGTCHKN